MKSLQEPSLCPRCNSGSILVICIWVLVFFSILCAGLYSIVSAQIRLVKRVEDGVMCENLAKSAFIYVRRERLNDETSYDTLYELGQKKERELGLGKFSYSITDEESRININLASEEVIASLPGLNLELANNITISSLRPFHAKEELLLVDDITEEIFDKFKDLVTIYSDGKINVNTASGEVLTIAGLDSETASAIVDYRKGADMQEATEDDEVFENTGEIIEKLRSFRGISEAQESMLLTLISGGLLSVSASNYSLNVETAIMGKPAMNYTIVMDEEKIRHWEER